MVYWRASPRWRLIAEIDFDRCPFANPELEAVLPTSLEECFERIVGLIPRPIAINGVIIAFRIDGGNRIGKNDIVFRLLATRMNEPRERLTLGVAVFSIARKYIGVRDDPLEKFRFHIAIAPMVRNLEYINMDGVSVEESGLGQTLNDLV